MSAQPNPTTNITSGARANFSSSSSPPNPNGNTTNTNHNGTTTNTNSNDINSHDHDSGSESESDNLDSDSDTNPPTLSSRGIPTRRRVRVQMHECEALVTCFRSFLLARPAGIRIPSSLPWPAYSLPCRRRGFHIALYMRSLPPLPSQQQQPQPQPQPQQLQQGGGGGGRGRVLRPSDHVVWDEIAGTTVEGVGAGEMTELPCGRFAVQFVRVRDELGALTPGMNELAVSDEEYWTS
ncbi:hypothetical protein Daesc_006334 [Daldinia eschscholtzii]|uniref:Uncharacterized protein n=1 Tax=Daldinia eschscholtzii TaxID=292717 RepID=A0AAX6MGR2_9PEZI